MRRSDELLARGAERPSVGEAAVKLPDCIATGICSLPGVLLDVAAIDVSDTAGELGTGDRAI